MEKDYADGILFVVLCSEISVYNFISAINRDYQTEIVLDESFDDMEILGSKVWLLLVPIGTEDRVVDLLSGDPGVLMAERVPVRKLC